MSDFKGSVKVVIGKRGDSIEEPLPFFLPPYIEGVTLGSFVIVEIGGRLRVGCVVGKGEGKGREPVLAILPIPPLPSSLLALAHWLSKEYLCSLQDAFQSIVPEVLNARPSLYLYPNVDYQKVRGKVRKQMVREASNGIPYTALRAFPTPEARKKILALLNARILLPKVELSFKESSREEVSTLLHPPLPPLLHSPASLPPYPILILWGGSRLRRLGYYLGIILEVINKGGNAILITPDVPSAEWVGKTLAQFVERTYIYHRQLPLGERYDFWVKCASSFHSALVVGNRSALFVPLPNVKLIIVEGDGETSLIRQEPPSYEAGNVALQRALQEGGRVIFGSDIPSLARFSLAKRRKIPLVRLPFHWGELEIKDISKEKRIIPPSTKQAIEDALRQNGKVVLVVNRKGLFYIFCKDCGNTFLCPSCNVPLIVYEKARDKERFLFCHLCGTLIKAPDVCPLCGSYKIAVRGIGLQRLASAVRRLFPQKKVVTLSSETPRQPFWEADIIVATKAVIPWMEIIKPFLSSMFDVDSLLSFPHFAQSENIYRLLFTLRKESKYVIIHTKQPDNPLFISSPLDFLEKESRLREEKRFPPFGHVLHFLFDDPEEAKAKGKAEELYEYLLGRGFPCLPPFPSLYPKRRGVYRYLLVIPSLTLFRAGKILKTALRFRRNLKWFLDVQEML